MNYRTRPSLTSLAVSELVLLTMALVAISTDSSQMGSPELNKALEIELG